MKIMLDFIPLESLHFTGVQFVCSCIYILYLPPDYLKIVRNRFQYLNKTGALDIYLSFHECSSVNIGYGLVKRQLILNYGSKAFNNSSDLLCHGELTIVTF